MTISRAFIILFAIVIFSCASTFMLSLRAIQEDDKKFCLLVENRTEYPVTRPKNPKLHPQQEIAWEKYERALRVSKEIGCK